VINIHGVSIAIAIFLLYTCGQKSSVCPLAYGRGASQTQPGYYSRVIALTGDAPVVGVSGEMNIVGNVNYVL